MKRKPQSSMDGFVPRRPQVASGRPITTSRQTARPQIGVTSSPRQLHQATGEGLKTDIAQSLQSIDNEAEEAPKRRRRLFRRKQDKKPQSRRRKIIKRVAIVLLVIALLAGGYFGWKFLHTSGKILSGNFLGMFQHQRLKEDENGRTNILIFGTSGWSMEGDDWDGAMLTDSIMVASVDQDENDVYTVSLPRDLYVGTCTATGKLNEVYWCAQQAGKSDEDAAAEFKKVAGEILGLDVQYYVHANWKAMVQGVDAVGGVDIKIEGTSGEGIYDVATNIRYKEGEIAHLNGERALALARARGSAGGYGLDGSNFAREMNQQKLLAALQKKATSASTLANPVAVNGLFDALGDNLRTNFQTNEVQALIDIAKNNNKMTRLPLYDRPDDEPNLVEPGSFGGISAVLPTAGQGNYTEIRAYIRKSILGSKTGNLDVLNGSGLAGHAQEKAQELEKLGYVIEAVANAPSEISSAVQIYQVNDQKTEVATRLKETYSVEIKDGVPAGYTPSSDADFVLIFGAG